MGNFEQIIIDYTPWIVVLSIFFGALIVIWNIFLQVSLKKVKSNQKSLFSGKNGVDLEKIILSQKKDIKNLDSDIQQLYDVTNKLNQLARKSLQKVGVVRFNPFKDIGGNQSFSIALLDKEDNGLVISSLHTREGTRTYAKPVKEKESDKYPLTEEEVSAIEIASAKKVEKSKNKKV